MSNYDDLVKQKEHYDSANNKADNDFSKYILYSCGGGIIALIPYIISSTRFGMVAEKLIACLLIIGATNILNRYVFMKSSYRYSLNFVQAINSMNGDELSENNNEIIERNVWVSISKVLEVIIVAEVFIFIIIVGILIF